jgi:hypothetical protein
MPQSLPRVLPPEPARQTLPDMKPNALVAGLLLCAVLSPAMAQEKSSTRSFRWVDEKGAVHYGDSVPPQYSRQQTSELNTQGVELRRTPAQLSPSEASSAEEREALLARQKQHDQFLLSTYTSTRDIEQLRDERVGLIDAQITAAQGFLSAAETRMKSLRERAKSFKPYAETPNARRMPDPLAEDLVRTLNEERAQRNVMEQKKKEKDQLRASFQSDIDRYQHLLASRSPSR